jgi:hypothetical protein
MAFKSKRERFIKLTSFSVLILLIIFIVSFPSARRRIFVIFSPSCINYKQTAYSSRLKDRIVDYSAGTKAAGIKECRNEAEIRERVREGELVHIGAKRFYLMDRLTYSYPYLTPGSRDLLNEIGRRFREKTNRAGLRGSKFIITSLTRTTEQMKRLRKKNSNASANSPHLSGNAFDISYARFSSRKFFITPCDERFFKEALAEIIVELREEGKCWATYERNQNCFHIVER